MPKKARSQKGSPPREPPPDAQVGATEVDGDGEASRPSSFEEAFAIVEGAVEGLERGNLPLEESLREYETGLRALRSCYEILGQAQKRIEVLSAELGAVAGEAWKPAAADARLKETVDSLDDLPEE